MSIDLSAVSVSATKPLGKVARLLGDLGMMIVPVEEDEGNVDRYLTGRRLVIERRTGGSFLAGIMDKTLFTSAIYMREHFEVPVLIVEGSVNYQYSMMDPQAVRGAMSSMLLQYGLNVLATKAVGETAHLIAMMARQEQVGIPEISLVPKRTATSLDDLQRRLIEMLPGCGRVLARELLQHFGSVKAVLSATAAQLRSVRGIGAKKAATMVRVLNADYAAVDTEKQLEDAIEADHSLLFDRPVTMLDRQHYIFAEGDRRHIVDMVFLDEDAEELILVELKRGWLDRMHYAQLCRYLDNADRSPLLQERLAAGASLRGVLATVEPTTFKARRKDVSVKVVDRDRTIAVLRLLRQQRPE